MRKFSLVVSALAAAAFAAPAASASFPGAAGAPGPIGDAPLPPSPPSGDGASVPRAPSGPNHGPGNGLAGPSHGARPSGGPSRRRALYGSGDHVPAVDGRHRARRYWLGGGPVLTPDSSNDYVLGDVDYDDGGDPTGCTVFHKALDGGGRFVGWVRINLCDGR